jgi:hypothetical protein
MEAMMKTTNAKTTADKRLNGHTGGPAPAKAARLKAAKKGTIHSAPVGGKSPFTDPDDAPFTDVLKLVPALSEAVRDLTDDPKINAIMAGIEPILTEASGSTDLNDVEFSGQQVIALLQMLQEEIPAAANDVPQFKAVQHRIARVRSLVAAYLPPADAAMAAPGPNTQAGEASLEEGGRFTTVDEIGEELWNVRALVTSLHDSMDFDKCNRERRILRIIDERLAYALAPSDSAEIAAS